MLMLITDVLEGDEKRCTIRISESSSHKGGLAHLWNGEVVWISNAVGNTVTLSLPIESTIHLRNFLLALLNDANVLHRIVQA